MNITDLKIGPVTFLHDPKHNLPSYTYTTYDQVYNI